MKSLLLLILPYFFSQTVRVPIGKPNEISIQQIELTEIGEFGVLRKARPNIPAHLHTGIDIKPPKGNYLTEEPIYAIAKGKVISRRTDGAYAQLIIEHRFSNEVFWTVYEHIAGVKVELFQPIAEGQELARFFKVEELDQIGWQFNHFHFEILKSRPYEIRVTEENPDRLFNSYSLSCFSNQELHLNFYNPIEFLKEKHNH